MSLKRSVAIAMAGLVAGAGGCSSDSKKYADCEAVRAAGKAPLHKGDPGYSKALDRDGDGVACS
jgi:Excalibur calcium-binding domain